MKLLLLLLLTFTAPIHADPLKSEDKTKRMAQIEARFNVVMTGILRTSGHQDFWIFLEGQPSSTFDVVPIVIPANGTDHDFEIARVAAENCAAFYDEEIKRERAGPHPTPAAYRFTVPTSPRKESK